MARSYECDNCGNVQVVGVIDNGLSGFADPRVPCEGCGKAGQFHYGPGWRTRQRQMMERAARSIRKLR